MGSESIDQLEPKADAAEANRHGFLGWFLWPLVVFVLYVLSIGPAARLHAAFPPARKALEALYLPITALCERSPAAQQATIWYLENVWHYPISPK